MDDLHAARPGDGGIVPLSFWNDATAAYTREDGWGWQGSWTVFSWVWTVTWSPFIGLFVARISRGRPLAMFTFFEYFPLTTLVQGLAVLIVAIFFATSSDSASLVVDLLCTGDEDPGPVRQRVSGARPRVRRPRH